MRVSRPERPVPIPVRSYRYSKWRWRVLVRLIDAIGAALMVAWRLVRPKPIVSQPQRVLLVQLDHLGDAVLSSPLIEAIRARYPSARIDALASESNRALFAADPRINRVHVASRNWFERRPESWSLIHAVWVLGRGLRHERYDLGFDVRGDVLSVLVLALAGVRRRVGWSMGGGGFLLTDVVPWVPGRHEVRSRLALLGPLGGPLRGRKRRSGGPRVSVGLTDRDRTRVHLLMRQAWPPGRQAGHATARSSRTRVRAFDAAAARTTTHGRVDPEWRHAGRFADEAPLLAVHVGAGTEAKRWPIASWRVLLGRFLADGWRVVVVGGPDDVAAARGLPVHADLQDWTGRLSVSETVAVLERADLFLGADSGPAHLAAAAGTPSVVLFSGTNRASQWRPWSKNTLVLRKNVPCQPCHRKVCPLADHPCLTGMAPDRVARVARRWWLRSLRVDAHHD
jgi:heptosyltransferase-2